MKTIVTHYNPDLDALCAVWLVKKFMRGWEDAKVEFVVAGGTLDKQEVDKDPDVIHVDTGGGRFDHHETNKDVCASVLVWRWIKKYQISNIPAVSGASKNQNDNSKLKMGKRHVEEAIERLVRVVNDVDHFREVYWPEPEADHYDFSLERIIDGWKILYPNENLRFVEWGFDCLDGILTTFKNKVWAEEELEEGIIFETKWGRGIGMETVNDEVIHLGQKKGYAIVVRKDPRKGYLRIKSLPAAEISLQEVFEKLKKEDPSATWFLHVSEHMILNGSTKNPEMRATRLTLQEVIEIIKKN